MSDVSKRLSGKGDQLTEPAVQAREKALELFIETDKMTP
jgi:hypothetical protein